VPKCVDRKQGLLANIFEFARIRDTAAQEVRNCRTHFVDERAKAFAIAFLRMLQQYAHLRLRGL
jgi:hypothetical protein